MRFVTAALLGLLLSSGTANAEEYVLAISPGGPYAATPGGEIARNRYRFPRDGREYLGFLYTTRFLIPRETDAHGLDVPPDN